MTPQPMVIVPYVPGQLCRETITAVTRQYPDAVFEELLKENPYSYANLIRRRWRMSGPLIICEQDVIPPELSILNLLLCEHDWCCHPHPLAGGLTEGTLGLAKFSDRLRQKVPWLADLTLGKPDPRFATRAGLTAIPGEHIDTANPRRLDRACLRPGAVDPWPADNIEAWPSTVHWQICDSVLMRDLLHRGYSWHTHQPPTVHLHDYGLAV